MVTRQELYGLFTGLSRAIPLDQKTMGFFNFKISLTKDLNLAFDSFVASLLAYKEEPNYSHHLAAFKEFRDFSLMLDDELKTHIFFKEYKKIMVRLDNFYNDYDQKKDRAKYVYNYGIASVDNALSLYDEIFHFMGPLSAADKLKKNSHKRYEPLYMKAKNIFVEDASHDHFLQYSKTLNTLYVENINELQLEIKSTKLSTHKRVFEKLDNFSLAVSLFGEAIDAYEVELLLN